MKISWISIWPPRITAISEYSESIVSKLKSEHHVNVISHIDAGRPGETHLSPIINLEKSDWPQTVFDSIEKYKPNLVVLNHDFTSFGYRKLATSFSQNPEDGFGFLELLFRLKNSNIPRIVIYHDLMEPLSDAQKTFYDISTKLSTASGVFGLKNKNLFINMFHVLAGKVFDVPIITESYHQYSKEHLREKWNIGKDKIVFGMVGFLENYKNFEYIIDVFNRFEKRDDAELIIAGIGLPGHDESLRYEKQILEKIKTSKITNKIKLINRFLENTELNEVIQSLDALILPYSRCSQSIIMGKAISFGIPIISSACSNLADVLRKTKSGLYIDINNKTKTYDVFNRILKNPNILNRLSINSLKYYQNNNIEKTIDLYSRFFKNIC